MHTAAVDVDPALLAFAGIVLAAYVVQTVAGFGSTLLSVTLGALFLPITDIVVMIVPLALLQTGYIAIRHRKDVRWRLLLRRVLPLMGAGMVVGFLARDALEGRLLVMLFGVLVFVLAARDLVAMRRAEPRPISPPASFAALLGAGVVHGIYATGGPLLVYAIGREQLTKGEIRATLTVVWLILDSALSAAFAFEGRYDVATLGSIAILIPAIPIGIVIGEVVHHRVNERHFRAGVFGLLLVAAVVLIAGA